MARAADHPRFRPELRLLPFRGSRSGTNAACSPGAPACVPAGDACSPTSTSPPTSTSIIRLRCEAVARLRSARRGRGVAISGRSAARLFGVSASATRLLPSSCRTSQRRACRRASRGDVPPDRFFAGAPRSRQDRPSTTDAQRHHAREHAARHHAGAYRLRRGPPARPGRGSGGSSTRCFNRRIVTLVDARAYLRRESVRSRSATRSPASFDRGRRAARSRRWRPIGPPRSSSTHGFPRPVVQLAVRDERRSLASGTSTSAIASERVAHRVRGRLSPRPRDVPPRHRASQRDAGAGWVIVRVTATRSPRPRPVRYVNFGRYSPPGLHVARVAPADNRSRSVTLQQ